MEFRIADTFTDSLGRLTAEEQKSAKTTAFDLQLNPAQPGHQFHRLDKAKDPNFWSVRVSSDIRLIVHRTASSLLLCYVDRHDKAYAWAERRKLETHPRTGAAQFVEIRETVREIVIPTYVEAPRPTARKSPLFANLSEEQLLNYGVPAEWLADVRAAVDDDSLLAVAEHLPSEAAEALLQVATVGAPQVEPRYVGGRGIGEFAPLIVAQGGFGEADEELNALESRGPLREADPFDHPDAKRRFRLIESAEELARALEYPWEKWTIFLHPQQRELVERDYSGPARVAGSAGTGKTIVALHRAVFLARNHPDARVLLTTFSEALANALKTKLRRLIGSEPRLAERLEVQAIDTIGRRLYESQFGVPKIATQDVIQRLLADAATDAPGNKFSQRFLMTELEDVVDSWQLDSWEAYRDVRRLGRRTRLSEQQRLGLWAIFAAIRSKLESEGLMTMAGMYQRLTVQVTKRRNPPFDYVVVDEAQDVSIPQLRFLAALGEGRPDSLFFAGDLGQRIFQQPFSWKALGVDIRGRSRTLHINYRTSHQIRNQADRLLGPELADVDGNTEERRGTVSVFNGPAPTVQVLNSQETEAQVVGTWLQQRHGEGVTLDEMGVFVRSDSELTRARAALDHAGLPYRELDERVETASGHVSIGTMHLAKGLEFRAVAVMACDDEVIPLQSRIEAVTDDSDLEEVYNTERHLLYVACTRARDHLLVTSVEPGSEFLDDLRLERVVARRDSER